MSEESTHTPGPDRALEYLLQQYPAVFFRREAGDVAAYPLAIGVGESILASIESADDDLGFTVSDMKTALSRVTNKAAYHKRIAKGGPRFDLQGNEAGGIEKKHRDHAKKTLGRSRKKPKPQPSTSEAGRKSSAEAGSQAQGDTGSEGGEGPQKVIIKRKRWPSSRPQAGATEKPRRPKLSLVKG